MDSISTTGHTGESNGKVDPLQEPALSSASIHSEETGLGDSTLGLADPKQDLTPTAGHSDKIDPVKPHFPLIMGTLILLVAAIGGWIIYAITGPSGEEATSFLVRLMVFIGVVGVTILILGVYIQRTLNSDRVFYRLSISDYRELFVQLLPGVTLAALGNTLTPEFGWISLGLGIALSVLTLRRTGPKPTDPDDRAKG